MKEITCRSEFAGERCVVLPLPGPVAICRAIAQGRAARWQVLPHEVVFGALIVIVLSRLVLAQGGFGPLSLVYGGMLVVIVASVAWCRARESDLRWRIRYGIYPALINVCYLTLGFAVPVYHPGKVDAVLQSLDVHMVGGNVSLWMERAAHPVLTEILSACYLAFFPYVMLSWLHYFRRELPVLRRFVTGMFTVYGIGYLGYALAPAEGPQLDPALGSQFAGVLGGGWITELNAELMLMGSNRVDAFPSLHCAVTAFTLLFDRVHAPRRFRRWALPLAGLWIATIYLRYHYLTDVVAGMVLAGAAFVMVQLPRKASIPETRHGSASLSRITDHASRT
jgi:hypothetical protein